jgi:hypothetical protein
MRNHSTQETKAQRIDLKEVAELIAALERDLAKVAVGSADLRSLKEEVETLRNVLNSPRPREGWVRDGLHDIRAVMEHALGTVAGEAIRDWPYIADIGRMLGMQ